VAKSKSYILVAALAVSASVLAAAPVAAQSTGATVLASATFVGAVGLQAPTGFGLTSHGAHGLSLDGALQVTSPAPHVLTAQVEAWGRGAAFEGFSRVHPGRLGTLPEEVRVSTANGVGSGVVRVTYTVAVIF